LVRSKGPTSADHIEGPIRFGQAGLHRNGVTKLATYPITPPRLNRCVQGLAGLPEEPASIAVPTLSSMIVIASLTGMAARYGGSAVKASNMSAVVIIRASSSIRSPFNPRGYGSCRRVACSGRSISVLKCWPHIARPCQWRSSQIRNFNESAVQWRHPNANSARRGLKQYPQTAFGMDAPVI
jgi:hypothetical protein